MDLGRYSDLLLNVILGILIFFFPGGYTWLLFLGMAGSHAYIYLFDQVKVLRSIPECTYASYEVEWCCQAMFAPIIGMMASCLVFKGNCEPGFPCTSGTPLLYLMGLAFWAHTIVHLLVLWFLVPRCCPKSKSDPEADKTYKEVAKDLPSSWFSCNKVHCLRSKLIYGHSPPCSPVIPGKEDYMDANPSIGCYFEDKKVV